MSASRVAKSLSRAALADAGDLDFDFGLDSSSDLASGLEEGEEEANLEAGVDVYFEEDNFLNKDFECFDEDDVWKDCKNGAVDEKDVVDSLDCVVDMLALDSMRLDCPSLLLVLLNNSTMRHRSITL